MILGRQRAPQPGASDGRDRRKEGDARPDRFPKQASLIKPVHIWSAAAFVAVIVGLGFVKVSGGYIPGLFADRTQTAESSGSNFDEPQFRFEPPYLAVLPCLRRERLLPEL
jgi:hypothetical protein